MLQDDICKCSGRMRELLLVNSEQYPPSPERKQIGPKTIAQAANERYSLIKQSYLKTRSNPNVSVSRTAPRKKGAAVWNRHDVNKTRTRPQRVCGWDRASVRSPNAYLAFGARLFVYEQNPACHNTFRT